MEITKYTKHKKSILFTCILLCYILYIIFYKLRHPFWSKQPVSHYHIPFSYGLTNKIIQNEHFKIDTYIQNYVDVSNVDIVISNNMNSNGAEEKLEHICKLVQSQYLNQEECFYNPTLREIKHYFSHHHSNSVFALYKEPNSSNPNNSYISCITTRPIYYSYKGHYEENYNPYISKSNEVDKVDKMGDISVLEGLNTNKQHYQESIYYVDYLTTHSTYRKKNITPKIIATLIHTVNQYHKLHMLNTPVFLFKREGTLAPFKSITNYDTSIYELHNDVLEPFVMAKQNEYQIQYIDDQRLEVLEQLWHNGASIHKTFKKVFHSHIEHIYELIQQRILYVFVIYHREKTIPSGIIIFQNPQMYKYALSQKQMLSTNSHHITTPDYQSPKRNFMYMNLYASAKLDDDMSDADFGLCMMRGLYYIQHRQHTTYPIFRLLVEHISHNKKLFMLPHWDTILSHIVSLPTAYYTYNYYCRNIDSSECFILV